MSPSSIRDAVEAFEQGNINYTKLKKLLAQLSLSAPQQSQGAQDIYDQAEARDHHPDSLTWLAALADDKLITPDELAELCAAAEDDPRGLG